MLGISNSHGGYTVEYTFFILSSVSQYDIITINGSSLTLQVRFRVLRECISTAVRYLCEAERHPRGEDGSWRLCHEKFSRRLDIGGEIHWPGMSAMPLAARRPATNIRSALL